MLMDVQLEYERIDRIRSITAMKRALTDLAVDHRQDVILLALKSSRCQWTWSFFAREFEVPNPYENVAFRDPI